jgi:two-component system alkaline phosphatase synthesis response regulator PhoP
MHHVAVVEDEELIRTMIRLNLEREGYAVSCYDSAEALEEVLDAVAFDIILLDIALPGISGEELIERIRGRGIVTPVLMVTARSDVRMKVSTLEKGADDYLAKPFDMDELIVRVKALIRRSQGERAIPADRVVKIGRFAANLETRTATSNRGEVVLSEKECALLELFARNAGRTLTRADILEEVWGMDVDPTPRTVDNFVVRLRRLFEEDPDQPRHFLTVRAAGYRFEH